MKAPGWWAPFWKKIKPVWSPMPPNQGWENGVFWLCMATSLIWGGWGIYCSILFSPRLYFFNSLIFQERTREITTRAKPWQWLVSGYRNKHIVHIVFEKKLLKSVSNSVMAGQPTKFTQDCTLVAPGGLW